MVERILVLGATGSTGRRVTSILRAKGVPVSAASRSGEVRFDWTDPATWEPALRGATGMYLMAPHELPIDPELVRAAVELGVRRIVLLSSGGIELMGDERLIGAERVVRESGAEWTVLRPNWLDQNFDEGFFQPAIMAGELAVPVGDLRQPFVDAGDIAAVAAAALTEPGHAGQSYEITGPRALTFAEALDIIGEAAGRQVRHLPEAADYLAAMTGVGVPEEQAEADIQAYAALRSGGDQQPADTVHRVTGRPPKDFRDYAIEAAANDAW